jgi:hypothetical protein
LNLPLDSDGLAVPLYGEPEICDASRNNLTRAAKWVHHPLDAEIVDAGAEVVAQSPGRQSDLDLAAGRQPIEDAVGVLAGVGVDRDVDVVARSSFWPSVSRASLAMSRLPSTIRD